MKRQTSSEDMRQRASWVHSAQKRYEALKTIVDALYDEVDKLSRKKPDDPVTQLYLDRTNRIVGQVKSLLREDAEIAGESDDLVADITDDLRTLVPAGDMPERQDVLLVLRETKAALDRLEARYHKDWRMLRAATY